MIKERLYVVVRLAPSFVVLKYYILYYQFYLIIPTLLSLLPPNVHVLIPINKNEAIKSRHKICQKFHYFTIVFVSKTYFTVFTSLAYTKFKIPP